MEIDALFIAFLSLLIVSLIERFVMTRALSRLLVFLLIIGSQLLLFLMKSSGLLVLYPWEYVFLYEASYWIIYSLIKAFIISIVITRYRVIGLWLLVIVLLQPVATAINVVMIGPPSQVILVMGNESVRALVADTRLRTMCGYYCWSKADAIVFTNPPIGRAKITMLGISNHLLLILVKNSTVIKVLSMKPWRVYKVDIPPRTLVVETRLPLSITPGLHVVLKNP